MSLFFELAWLFHPRISLTIQNGAVSSSQYWYHRTCTPKKDVAHSCEMLLTVYQTTRHHIRKDRNHNTHRLENFKVHRWRNPKSAKPRVNPSHKMKGYQCRICTRSSGMMLPKQTVTLAQPPIKVDWWKCLVKIHKKSDPESMDSRQHFSELTTSRRILQTLRHSGTFTLRYCHV
jgi:hypothetical protein